jgi:branched-chain amino acid aminotransferase
MSTHFYFVNDSLVHADEACLLVGDMAIQRGYGIFDYFKTLGGHPLHLEEHLNRFLYSAEQMRLDMGRSRDELRAMIATLLDRNRIADSGVRLTLTGGYAPDGYSIARPNLVITQKPLAASTISDPAQGMRLMSYPHQRQLPEVKTIDYLMAIWLQPLLREKGVDEVIYHKDGVIAECPRSNFFLVTDRDVLVTPAANVLKGITRMKVLEVAKRQMTVEEREVRLEEIPRAKEAFITSTTKQVMPVTEMDGVQVGDGKIGPVVRWLSEQLLSRTQG